MLTYKTVCYPSEDVVAREIEGDIVLVPLVAGMGDADDELYTLNETGKLIWQKLDGEKSLGEIAGEIKNVFISSDDEIAQDVLGFVGELVKRGMLTVKD